MTRANPAERNQQRRRFDLRWSAALVLTPAFLRGFGDCFEFVDDDGHGSSFS
jgi:hypothetical protein